MNLQSLEVVYSTVVYANDRYHWTVEPRDALTAHRVDIFKGGPTIAQVTEIPIPKANDRS